MPSSLSRSFQTTRSFQNQIDTEPHSPVNNQRDILPDYVSLSPLIFQSPFSATNTRRPPITTTQPRHHSIFTPPVMNSPLPTIASSPSLCPNSIPPIAPQHNNILAPQPVQPILPLQFNQHSAPLTRSAYIPNTPRSNHSEHNISSRTILKFSLPSTKDIPLLTGKHDWGPWHSAVSSLILCSNLLSHIADDLLPGATYDPDLWPTYPPIL
jgi:hypothetical protein